MSALFAALTMMIQPVAPAAACGPEVRAALIAPAARAEAYDLTCSLTLRPGDQVLRRLSLTGADSTGVTLDCNGAAIGWPDQETTAARPTIAIASRQDDAGWSRPTDIAIVDCAIHGAIRVWGQGINGAAALKASSRTPGHTAAAQAAAPSRILIQDTTLDAEGTIPLYVGPGVTGVTLSDSRVTGRSVSTGVYLDAESADNRIIDTDFTVRTAREVIAIDGSARNVITGNRFDLGSGGGVFLYRNCGEDGVVRHQTPSDNQITANRFDLRTWVWPWTRLWPREVLVGSREGRRPYCDDDAGFAFGSSADDGDNARGNRVAGNSVRQ